MGASSEHFSDKELRCSCGCGKNECVPELLTALEWIRAAATRRFGDCVMPVHSAYRCADHPIEKSWLASGKKPSPHMRGLAADFHITVKGTQGKWRLSAGELEKLVRACPGVTGFGRDDHKDYIHVDVRPERTADNPAKWAYAADGKDIKCYPPAEAA